MGKGGLTTHTPPRCPFCRTIPPRTFPQKIDTSGHFILGCYLGIRSPPSKGRLLGGKLFSAFAEFIASNSQHCFLRSLVMAYVKYVKYVKKYQSLGSSSCPPASTVRPSHGQMESPPPKVTAKSVQEFPTGQKICPPKRISNTRDFSFIGAFGQLRNKGDLSHQVPCRDWPPNAFATFFFAPFFLFSV